MFLKSKLLRKFTLVTNPIINWKTEIVIQAKMPGVENLIEMYIKMYIWKYVDFKNEKQKWHAVWNFNEIKGSKQWQWK